MGTGGEDEGRAMAQNIYHIAPGAGLAFATGFGTDSAVRPEHPGPGQHGGRQVIVDDVGSLDDPFFQPGFIAPGDQHGRLRRASPTSPRPATRPTTATCRPSAESTAPSPAWAAGTFMNFDGNGGTSLLLPVTVNVANTIIDFQFDQPWATQEPAGSPWPNVPAQLLRARRQRHHRRLGHQQQRRHRQPQQVVTIPATGSYFVAIQLVSGPAPGHVEFVQFGQQSTNDLIVSQQFGSGGGTSYPTSFGHNAAANTIGVGAVPWWAPAPFLGQTPLASRAVQLRPARRSRSSTPTGRRSTTGGDHPEPDDHGPRRRQHLVLRLRRLAPTIRRSRPAGDQHEPLRHVHPDQSNLPSFFGTSSAAPNAAAIAALMLQRVPTATPAQIKQALIAVGLSTP